MAKAGFYLYGARGKVGNIVARKGPKGGTILAERVTPKNPKSNKQMGQRIILSTVAQAVKFLSPIVDHSFQGVAVGTACKERFRKLNMDRLRKLAAIDFEESPAAIDAGVFMSTKNIQALIPNNYIISTGNISASKLKAELSGVIDDGRHFNVVFPEFSIPVSGPADGVRSIKLGDILRGMFGITTAGEQITFVVIQKAGEGYQYAYKAEPDVPGWEIPYTSMKAVRLFVAPTVDLNQEFDITDDQGQPLENWEEAVYVNVVNAFGQSNRTDRQLLSFIEVWLTANTACDYDSANATVAVNYAGEKFDFTNYNTDDDTGLGYVYALGIIRSRLMEDGTWQYSNSAMLLNKPTTVVDTNFGLDWNSAIQAWFETNEITSNELYLRGGEKDNELGESFS